jgi:hypothetical protein
MKVSCPDRVAFLSLSAIPFQTDRFRVPAVTVPLGARPYAHKLQIADSNSAPASGAFAFLSTTQCMGAKAPAALNMKVFCLNMQVAENGSKLACRFAGTTALSRRHL